MANKKISQLSSTPTIGDTDNFVIERGGVNYKVPYSLVATAGEVSGVLGMTVSGSNSLSGIVNFIPSGNVSIYPQGNNIVISGDILTYSGFVANNFTSSANLQATGQQALSFANGIGTIISGNLTNTGVTLGAKIDSLSGYTNANFVSASALTSTGVQLGAKIDSLSGWSASAANLQLTGSNLYNLITSLSGQANTDYASKTSLTNSGVQLGSKIDSLSGYSNSTFATLVNVTTTGVTLGAKIDSLSGWAASAATVQLTGQQALSYAAGIGSIISGNLTTTGVTLGAKIDSLSGYSASVVNLATTGTNLYNLITAMSGQGVADYATKLNLQSTGSNLYSLLTNLSGQADTNYETKTNAALSGSNLYNLTVGLSGQVNNRFNTWGVKTLTVTGTQYSGDLFLTGIGTTEVSVLAGNIIRISGAAAGGGGGSYDDTYVVKTTGNQTINGYKTFMSGEHISGQFRYSATSIPATTGTAGLSGQFSWDQNFLYICVTNNYWKRAVLSDF